jgi:hypothetical protein
MSSLLVLNSEHSQEHRFSLESAFPELGSAEGAPFNTRYLKLPFEIQPSDAVRELLRKFLPNFLSWTTEEKKERGHLGYWEGKPPQTYSPFVDRLARFIVAFVGGAALVVPMIIMVFNSSVNKSLVVTSVAVVLFAAFLAVELRSSNTETLTATATYAAVLVVFVGTSLFPDSLAANGNASGNSSSIPETILS